MISSEVTTIKSLDTVFNKRTEGLALNAREGRPAATLRRSAEKRPAQYRRSRKNAGSRKSESRSSRRRVSSVASSIRPSRESAAARKARETLKRGLSSNRACRNLVGVGELPRMQIGNRKRIIGQIVQRIEWTKAQRAGGAIYRNFSRSHPR